MAKMSMTELTKALRDDAYVGRTDAQLQQEAEARIGENYDVMREAATQRQAAIDEAYARELSSLADTLSAGQQAVEQQAARSNAAINDYVYGRNMQRTSYSAGSQGSIGANLEQAAKLLKQQYDTASSGVENSRILLAEQLAGTLAQYDQDYLTDVQAYIDAQKQIEYDRKAAADAEYNALQMQLFELGKAGGGGGGGGYRRSSGSGSTQQQTNNGSLWDSLNQRTIYQTYSLNPSFGTVGQTTSSTKTTTANNKKVQTTVGSTTKAALSTNAARSEKIASKRTN